ncbi:MAG: glucose-6-phosphate dehydrogenase, partial [Campylobacter sp.]|nr:glucose-6-phosphate dehydrogenase [Campylobacter sp.]
PEFFMQSCENLALIGLNNPKVKIVLEKPLGKDLKSFRQINEKIAKYYKEQQIYRIDHYLGKESLQNLLILRSNPVFMSLWDKKHIQSVQISVFETLGVEARGEFYDKTGALRDMVQNHLLQILSLVAMKMPQNLDAKSIRAAKLKLLKSLKPLDKNKLKSQVIRAQYAKNSKFKAYLEEQNIQKNSQTETYVALKVEIDNSMWKGVPFYLRTGKRMAKQFAQIVVIFKDKRQENFINKLIIRLQPENFITLSLKTKKVGKGMEIEEKNLNLDFSSNSSKSMKAYERLILEVIEKNQTSFNHKEELEAAWLFVEPILQNWQEQKSPLFYYSAGSFGPKEALELIQKDDNQWYDEI